MKNNTDKFWKNVIGIIAGICLGVFLIWYLPDKFDSDSELKDNRATLIQIFGGILFIIGMYIANKRARAMEKNAKAATKQVKQLKKQNDEQRRSNIRSLTLNQYAKAVDQLKDESRAVRLGGIYSLEKIMNSPDKEVKDYHDTIIELLCAYVRENRPFDPVDYVKNPEKYKKPVKTDIQTILTVLGRRKNIDREKIINLDLSCTNLFNASLDVLHYEEDEPEISNFENVNLYKSYLETTELRLAKLDWAHLEEAYLNNKDLSDMNFTKVHLHRAHFEKSNLKGSKFEIAFLRGAHLENAILDNAVFLNSLTIGVTKEAIIDFIKELEKAKEVKGIILDDDIRKIIEEEFPDLLKRITE